MSERRKDIEAKSLFERTNEIAPAVAASDANGYASTPLPGEFEVKEGECPQLVPFSHVISMGRTARANTTQNSKAKPEGVRDGRQGHDRLVTLPCMGESMPASGHRGLASETAIASDLPPEVQEWEQHLNQVRDNLEAERISRRYTPSIGVRDYETVVSAVKHDWRSSVEDEIIRQQIATLMREDEGSITPSEGKQRYVGMGEATWSVRASTEAVSRSHHLLYERAQTSLSVGFASISKSLVSLQVQLELKLRKLYQEQEDVLRNQNLSRASVEEFYEASRRVEKSLESFEAHAENLAHVKLSIAKAAALVSPEGVLANIVSDITEMPQPVRSLALSRPYGRSNLERSLERYADSVPTSALGWRDHDPPRTQPIRDFGRREGSTCFVFYLPPSADNENIRNLFQRYGTVLNAYVAKDCTTGKTRGFGFVDFSSPIEARAAVEGLDKYPWDGKYLSVSIKV